MRITRVTKIQSHRVFQNFKWPSDLHNFGRFNLIYGWNGCGKTTLSSLFARLEKSANITEGQVEFEIDGDKKYAGSQLAEAVLPPVRVFNRDFVKATIAVVNQRVEPVYYLGEDSVEKQAEVERLGIELSQIAQELSNASANKKTAEATRNKSHVEQAKIIKEALTGAGIAKYNNYSKASFAKAIGALAEDGAAEAVLTDKEKEGFRKQKNAQPKAKVAEVSFRAPSFEEVHSTAEELLTRSVASAILDELAADIAVKNWVETGLGLHSKDRQSDTCRFCTQPFSPERRSALNGHFNDALKSFQDDINGCVTKLDSLRDLLSGVNTPESTKLYDHLQAELDSRAANAKTVFSAATDWLTDTTEVLKAKRASPFEEVEQKIVQALSAIPDASILESAVLAINEVIGQHNDISDNFAQEVANACQSLEAHFLAEAWQENSELALAIETAAALVVSLGENKTDTETKVSTIERSIRENRRPAEELNSELCAYLGRSELQFAVKQNGYVLTRSGQPATDLSEGERTAIAFLYFLKTLQGQRFDLKNGVVVIDDPVSSLDANSLFSAFGYMKERTKECGQLFILTHSFSFFQQVKNWYHHLKDQRKKDIQKRPARFFMLGTSLDDNGIRGAALGPLDSLLEGHQSEYHFLFRRVYDESLKEGAGESLEHHYGMPNIARRLVETFLAFRYPAIPGDLRKKLELVEFSDAKKIRILRLLHTYSHSDAIAEPGHDHSILAETQSVLCDILEMLKSVDPVHYKGMEQLVVADEGSDD